MDLLTLTKLKPGTEFFYKGELAEVLWTEDVTEEIGVFSGVMVYGRHTAIAFIVAPHGYAVTYRSCWPRPQECVFDEFSLN